MQQCPPAVVGGASANAAVSAGGCGGALLMQQCPPAVVGGGPLLMQAWSRRRLWAGPL